MCASAHAPGSLLARTIFQPIEESSRLFFGQASTSSDAVAASSSRLATLLHGHLLLALPFLTVAPAYVGRAMALVLSGSRWTPAGRIAATDALRAYCYYVPILGLNGVLEAFVQAVGSEAELGTLSSVFVLCSGVYALALFVLARGIAPSPSALVYAGAISMSVRLLWNARFARRWLAERGWPLPGLKTLLPHWAGVGAWMAAGIVAQRTRHLGVVRHVGFGALAGVLALCMTCVRASLCSADARSAATERAALRQLGTTLRRRRAKTA